MIFPPVTLHIYISWCHITYLYYIYIYYRPPTTCSFRRPSLILSFGALDDVFSRSVAPGGWLRRVECLRLKLQLEGADGRPSYGLLEGKFMEIMVILCVFLWFYGKLWWSYYVFFLMVLWEIMVILCFFNCFMGNYGDPMFFLWFYGKLWWSYVF
jgi:hypothetical protein